MRLERWWSAVPGVAPASVRRPAELVELSEQLYLSLWTLGVHFCIVGVAVSALYVAVGGALVHQPRAGVVVAAMFIAALVAVRWRWALYRRLRRTPHAAVLAGVVAAAAQAWIGRGADVVFCAVIIGLGVAGLVCGWRWMLTAGLVAGSGLLLGAHGSSDWVSVDSIAASEVIVPCCCVALVDRLAMFLLLVNEPSPVQASLPRGVRPRSAAEPRRAAPAESVHRDDAQRSPRPDAPGVSLTARQLQALLLASQGLRHSEIAACLGISARQVGRLLSQGRDRNGCATTTELIARAIAAGVIPHEPVDE